MVEDERETLELRWIRKSETKRKERRMAWARRVLQITGGQSWHGVCVCVRHSSIALACTVGKWKVTDIVWHCESCRFLSIIPHQGHSRGLNVVAPAFSTSGSGRGNGARGPLLLLIRADVWLSCMPAAEPNKDYVPGWWRQKKQRSLSRSVSLRTFGGVWLLQLYVDYF